MVRERRHHNNKGLRQIKRGKTQEQVEDMVRRILGRRDIDVPGNLRGLPRSSNQDG